MANMPNNQLDLISLLESESLFCRELITEAYSEPSQTSKVERFNKNSKRFLVVNYFHKTLHLYVWQGFEYASELIIGFIDLRTKY